MGMSQIILKVCQRLFQLIFLAENFEVIFFHNMPNRYRFAGKKGTYVELLNAMNLQI